MNSEIFFRRPVLTGAWIGGILAFIAYLPSVASVPLPWYRVAAVFVIGWLTFMLLLMGIKHAAAVNFICSICGGETRDTPCPHDRLVDVACALSAEDSEGRNVLLKAIRRLSREKAAGACLRQATALTDAVGVTERELDEALENERFKE